MATAALIWEEVEDAAKSAFHVWVGQPELRWARLAWGRLLERGLGNYGNPTEKCMVKIRFLALAGFYHDFCYVAWREEAYPDYQVWAELLEIHSFSLGQLAGISAEWSEEDTDSSRANKALSMLIAGARIDVVDNLTLSFGDTSSLLVSLWNSTKDHRQEECNEGYCDQCEESADSILNYDIEEKGPAYTWLDQGADVLLEG